MLSEARRGSSAIRTLSLIQEAPMNRWSPYFMSIVSQTIMSEREGVRRIQ